MLNSEQKPPFEVKLLREGILALTMPEEQGNDFYCRIWDYQKDRLLKFFNQEIPLVSMSECIFDVDGHFCDITFERQENGKIKVQLDNYDDEQEFYRLTFVCESKDLENKIFQPGF